MNTPSPAPCRPDLLASYFRSGDAMRSRSVSATVPSGVLDLPVLPARLVADWERDIAGQLALEPGDVEALPLARARTRWPDYRRCVQAVADWAQALGWPPALLASADIALMACRGARYHHDGAQYGGQVFCNLFLGEDRGLDLHFPGAGVRMPLVRGTVVVFDTGQPHAVIDRRGSGFDAGDFPPERDCSLVFLTWELPVEDAAVARTLGIRFDTDPAASAQPEEGVRLGGAAVEVCPDTGSWRPAGSQSGRDAA